MKKFAFILIIFPLFCFSQKPNKNDVPTTSLSSVEYDLTSKTLAPSDIYLPFKSIEIIDARFDTSKLGYEFHRQFDNNGYNDFKQIKLSKGIKESINFFYNDYYSLCLKGSINKLLIVLKTLWIDNLPRNDFAIERFNENAATSYQDIHVKWEYYIQRDSKYYPFKQIDTVYQLNQSVLLSRDYKFKKNNLSFFKFVLMSQLEQIDFSSINVDFENKKILTFNDIDSFNNKRFLIPVITSENIQKGVFQNFDEFRNNTPGIEDYELRKKSKEKLWVNKANSETIKNFYLMCDSTGVHVGSEKRLSVVRVGNTFEHFELCSISRSKTVIGNFLSIGLSAADRFDRDDYIYDKIGSGDGSKLSYILVPRQVNMENGKTY